MNPERKEILNLISLPGRLNAAETASGLALNQNIFPFWSVPASSSRWAIHRQEP